MTNIRSLVGSFENVVYNQIMETKTTSQQIEGNVRRISIICNDNPEWGTWGVWEDNGGHFVIGNARGRTVLHKSEADKFWSVVTRD